jgi:hypothetical protein
MGNVPAAGEQAHFVADHLEPVAVMLDLVHPPRAGGRIRCAGRALLEEDSIIERTVRDFSLGGVGIELPAAISILSTEFDLTFGQFTRRCETVWRQTDRMGLKVRTTRFAS